jgi:hypothetical protein
MDKPKIIKALEKIAIDKIQEEVNKIMYSVCSQMNVYENKLYFKLEKCADKFLSLRK